MWKIIYIYSIDINIQRTPNSIKRFLQSSGNRNIYTPESRHGPWKMTVWKRNWLSSSGFWSSLGCLVTPPKTNTSRHIPWTNAARKTKFSLQMAPFQVQQSSFSGGMLLPVFFIPPPPSPRKLRYPLKNCWLEVWLIFLTFSCGNGWFFCSFPCFLLQEVLSQFNHIFSHLLGHAGIGRLSLGAVTGDEKLMEVSVPSNLSVMSATWWKNAATRIPPKKHLLKIRPKKNQHLLLNLKKSSQSKLRISCHTKVPSFCRGNIFDELLFCENETWSFLPAETKILVVLRCCNFQHQATSNNPTSMSSNMFYSKPPRQLQ